MALSKTELEICKKQASYSYENAKDALKIALNGKFTSAQVDSLINNKPIKRGEIGTAITIRSLSRKM